MPKILDDCVKSVEKQENVDSAWGICIDSLRDAGKIKQNDAGKWVLTSKGRQASFTASLDSAIDFSLTASEDSDCGCSEDPAKTINEANDRFNDFMLDLVALSQENLPAQLDNKFKAVRDNYSKYLPVWRKHLDASHKGLFLCIEDLDNWKSANDLLPFISRVVMLYGSTIQSGLTQTSFGRISKKYMVEKVSSII
jgi:hypothetical protein